MGFLCSFIKFVSFSFLIKQFLSHRQIEGLDKELNSLTETKESLLSKVSESVYIQ